MKIGRNKTGRKNVEMIKTEELLALMKTARKRDLSKIKTELNKRGV